MSETNGRKPQRNPEESEAEITGQMLLFPRPDTGPGKLMRVLYGRAAARADRRHDLKPSLPRLEPAPEGLEAQPIHTPEPEPSEADLVRAAYKAVMPYEDWPDLPYNY